MLYPSFNYLGSGHVGSYGYSLINNMTPWKETKEKSESWLAFLLPLLTLGNSWYKHSSIYAVNVGTQKTNPQKQKPRKSRLLSSTKEEKNRIDLQAVLNQKLQKSRPRKLRNACNRFTCDNLMGHTVNLYSAYRFTLNV